MGTTQPGRQGGFTLMELMVVITIIAVASAMILPQMQGTFQEALLRSTSRQLAAALDLAYSRSVSLNQTHRIHLDLTTGRYVVEHQTHDSGREEFVPLKGVDGCEGVVDPRIAVRVQSGTADQPESTENGGAQASLSGDEESAAAPTDTISFYPDGTADGAEIILRDQQHFQLALRINPTTARVRVVDLKRE